MQEQREFIVEQDEPFRRCEYLFPELYVTPPSKNSALDLVYIAPKFTPPFKSMMEFVELIHFLK